MANIKDVAQAAGVSTATVSRVLANHISIKPETRRRVLEAIASLNYRPNLIARSLRAQKSKKIGLVVSDIRNPFFTALGRAVEDVAYEQGYSVLMCNTDENPDKEELYLNVLHDENVAGIIFSPTQQFGAAFQNYQSAIPMVIVDRYIETDKADLVLLDNVAAADELTTHLIQNGFCKIAGLFGDASATGRDRYQGFAQALRKHNLQDAGTHFIPPRIQPGYETALNLLERKDRPDAIFTSNSMLTAGVFRALRAKQIKVPNEVALVGFDETTWGQLVDPPITVMAQPTEEIGKTATELLFQRIQEPNRPSTKVILKGALIAGASSVKLK